MLKKAKEDLSLLMRSGKHIFVFELTYKLAATAIVYPLAVLVLNLVFRFAGISYLTNEYILKAEDQDIIKRLEGRENGG